MRIAPMLRRFAADTRGATAVEYGLLAACISLVVIAGVLNAGQALYKRFDDIAKALGFT